MRSRSPGRRLRGHLHPETGQRLGHQASRGAGPAGLSASTGQGLGRAGTRPGRAESAEVELGLVGKAGIGDVRGLVGQAGQVDRVLGKVNVNGGRFDGRGFVSAGFRKGFVFGHLDRRFDDGRSVLNRGVLNHHTLERIVGGRLLRALASGLGLGHPGGPSRLGRSLRPNLGSTSGNSGLALLGLTLLGSPGLGRSRFGRPRFGRAGRGCPGLRGQGLLLVEGHLLVRIPTRVENLRQVQGFADLGLAVRVEGRPPTLGPMRHRPVLDRGALVRGHRGLERGLPRHRERGRLLDRAVVLVVLVLVRTTPDRPTQQGRADRAQGAGGQREFFLVVQPATRDLDGDLEPLLGEEAENTTVPHFFGADDPGERAAFVACPDQQRLEVVTFKKQIHDYYSPVRRSRSGECRSPR